MRRTNHSCQQFLTGKLRSGRFSDSRRQPAALKMQSHVEHVLALTNSVLRGKPFQG
jgi:hypothetical protein